MFKRLKTLLIAGLGTVAICCGAGFSYWIYNEVSQREIKSGAEVEDIYENYNAGKPNPIAQYDMFLFPSTWYLSQYNDAKSLPEFKYGYIERKLNDKGEIVDTYYDTHGVSSVTSSSTNKAYVPETITNQYCHDIDNYEKPDSTEYKTFNKPKDKKSEPQFEGGIQLPKLFDEYTLPTGPAGWNDFSSPEIDGKDTTGINTNETDDGFQAGEGDGSKPIYQQLNIDDRLGYWYDLSASEGRFLPIKISFSGSISPETFSRLVTNPRTDMADANKYHNYSFGNWLFYNHNSKTHTEKPYNEPIDGFGNYDRANLFDVLSNLENMAVEDPLTGKYTIRLFASYNNGKDYKKSEKRINKDAYFDDIIDNESPNFLGSGWRDGLKVDYKTKEIIDQKTTYRYNTRYFTFQKGDQAQVATLNDNKEYKFNTATINNFNSDDKELAYIDFSGTHTTYYINDDGNIIIWNRYYWVDSSYGEWSNSSKISNPSIFNTEYIAPQDNKNNRTVFSSGDYNIYAVGFDKRYKNESEARVDLDRLLATMKKSPNSDTYIGLSGNILGRELSRVLNRRGDNYMFMKEGPEGNKTGKPYRAYALFYERILDFKIVNDIPVNNTSVGNTPEGVPIYEEVNEGELMDHYNKVYPTSRNLFLEDNKFYIGTADDKNNFTPNKKDPQSNVPITLNETNKFIYKIDSLDLTEAKTLFSTVRVEKDYSVLSQHVEFNLNPLPEGQILYEHNSENNVGLGANETGKINGDGSNAFINASEFIEKVFVREKNGNQYDAFKLKQTDTISPYAYYSIVIVFNPDEAHPFRFDVYVYKQKTTFIKIFDKRPNPYGADSDKKGFLNHEAGEYYYHLYDYNVGMTGGDIYASNTNTQETHTIGQVFNIYCTLRHSYTGTDPNWREDIYYRDDDKDGEETYYLIDHVTRIIVAKATYTDKGFVISVNEGTALNITKNHVFYVISNSEYEADEFNPLNPSSPYYEK